MFGLCPRRHRVSVGFCSNRRTCDTSRVETMTDFFFHFTGRKRRRRALLHSSLLFDVWPDSSLTCRWCLSLRPRRRHRCALCVPQQVVSAIVFRPGRSFCCSTSWSFGTNSCCVMNNYCGNVVFFFSSHTRCTYCAQRDCTYQSLQTSNSPIH